ncbi:hypothetical protein PT277_00255, partial [Acetobacteraceae bacterium ESL0709]|nr:hypothetical protein [Acetobacteraceae bacterium ESL0709]
LMYYKAALSLQTPGSAGYSTLHFKCSFHITFKSFALDDQIFAQPFLGRDQYGYAIFFIHASWEFQMIAQKRYMFSGVVSSMGRSSQRITRGTDLVSPNEH